MEESDWSGGRRQLPQERPVHCGVQGGDTAWWKEACSFKTECVDDPWRVWEVCALMPLKNWPLQRVLSFVGWEIVWGKAMCIRAWRLLRQTLEARQWRRMLASLGIDKLEVRGTSQRGAQRFFLTPDCDWLVTFSSSIFLERERTRGWSDPQTSVGVLGGDEDRKSDHN